MRALLASLALLTVACGATSPNGGNTPPPGGTVAAILAVQAGDGQQAEPGAALTVKPVVAVKDAAGRGVAGVTVNFSVDSGGGSLQAASAVTAADGTAGPGDWHLGSGEGRNVMSATAGSLTKVRFVATAVVAPVTVATQSVGTGGGTITITRPGAPLDGMRLQIPAGSYPTSTTWTITYQSASTITRTPVMNPVSPIIRLTGTATGYSANLLTITIPATIPANTFPVIILRDPSTGVIEALPTTDYDGASVTAVTRHLNAAFLLKNTATRTGGLRGLFAVRNGGYDVEVVVSTLTRAQLDADFDSGFRPGTDDWGVENPGTFFQPNGICGGMTLTAMWYFANKKADGNLFHRLDRALGVPISNRGGIRWSSRVNAAQPDGAFGAAMQAATDSARRNPAVTSGQIRYDMIKAQLLVSQLPQLIVVAGSSISHAVMAYRTAGSSIYIADPNVPGGLNQTVRFGLSEFAPYYMASTTGGGPLVQMRYVAGLGASALYDMGNFPDEYAQAVDGSIDEEIFPVTEMRNRFGVLSDTIYLADTMATWVQCAACQSYPVPAGLTGVSGPLALLTLFRNPGGNLPWSPRGEGVVNLLNPASFANPGDFGFGYAITGMNAADEVWIDWKTYIIRKLDGSITPAAPTDVIGNPISFTMQVTPNKLPSDVIYRWDFNDGTAPVSVNNNNAVQHAFPRAGSFAIATQILDARTQQPVAKATTTVTITPPIQVWKITSKSVAFSTSGIFSANFGYSDSRWLVDSTILARIAAGVSQGGIRLVDAPFTPTGFPPRTAPAGIYLLEGASITLATLDDPATENNFTTTTFPNAPLALPAAPRVSGWNLVQDAAPVNPLCNVQSDTYTRTGTITAGRVTGRRVPLCMQSAILPNTNGQRLMSMEVDVQFIGDVASGTITITYHFFGEGLQSQNDAQRIGRLTFQGTRVTQ